MPGTISSSGFGISIASPPPSFFRTKTSHRWFLFWGRKISFSYPRLESELIQCINLKNEGKKNEWIKNEWMREECVCFISRDINKLLDIYAKNNQTTIPEGVRTRRFLLRLLAGCKRCPGVHASHDFKQSVFSEKNGYSFGLSRYGYQKSVYSYSFKQPCGYFF